MKKSGVKRKIQSICTVAFKTNTSRKFVSPFADGVTAIHFIPLHCFELTLKLQTHRRDAALLIFLVIFEHDNKSVCPAGDFLSPVTNLFPESVVRYSRSAAFYCLQTVKLK